MKVLLTGATGFVGRVLCDHLARRAVAVRAALRAKCAVEDGVVDITIVGEIGSATSWHLALSGVDAVIHLAARAHVLSDGADRVDVYEETNAAGTRQLAAEAVDAGVRRFIYLSSVKVNGETTGALPFSATDTPCPIGAYALSKWHAERYLLEVAAGSAMEVAIVRPPLVYGPEVRANFLRLLEWVDLSLPLPLGAVRNVRSMISVWNLCDFIACLLEVPVLPHHTWLISDGEDLSTPELVRRIGSAMSRETRLIYLPVRVLELAARLFGKEDEVQRLCSSLAIDSEPARRLLGWSAPVTVDTAIARTVSWYLSRVPRRAS